MFDGRWRTSVDQVTRPVGAAIQQTGVTADHLTAVGLGMAVATAVAIGSGRLLLGFTLLVLAALPDMLDGAVAKASGTASPRGAFFDSTADRVTDSLILGGIAWHLMGTEGGHLAMLPFAVLGTSTLISYQRAKAESLGYRAKGGLMERAERIIALAAGLAFPALLVPVLWLMLALTAVTAVQRFVMVWRQASAPRPARPEPRWRSWREANPPRMRARRTATRERWARSRRPATAEGGRATEGRWRGRAGTRPRP